MYDIGKNGSRGKIARRFIVQSNMALSEHTNRSLMFPRKMTVRILSIDNGGSDQLRVCISDLMALDPH